MNTRTKNSLVIRLFLLGLFFTFAASAQIVPTNLWNPNYGSSTITPRPSSLQIPCANIVGGCGGGGISPTSTNNFTVTQNFNGISNTGNVSSTSITANSTSSPTTIVDFQNTLEVPTPWISAFYGDFGTYENNWYNQQVANGLHAVEVDMPSTGIPSGGWAVAVDNEATSTNVLFHCAAQAPVNWTGTNTSTILNAGTSNRNWESGFDGCYIDGGGRVNQTFLVAGGSNGAYGLRITNDYIRNFNQGVVLGNNSPMPYMANTTFNFVNQPIYYNFGVLTNAGENNGFDHVIFIGCNSPGVLNQQAIYIKNAAGTDFFSPSFDDCIPYFADGDLGTNIYGGWSENASGNTNGVGSSTAFMIIATSTTTDVNIYGTAFYQDSNSSSVVPYAFIENDASLNIYGAQATANGNASSVAMFVHGNSTAFNNICGFVNTNNGTTTAVSSTINSFATNGAIPNTQGSGTTCVPQNANGYAYANRLNGNTYQTYFGNGVTQSLVVPAGGSSGNLLYGIGGSATPTSTFDVLGTLGVNMTTFNNSAIIPTNTAGSNQVMYFFTGTTSSTLTLPLASSTQHRIYVISNDSATAGVTLTVQATSTDHIFATSSVTSFLLPFQASSSLRIGNPGGTTWFSW